MRKWLLAAAAAAIFVAPSAAMAQAPIVIKFSHVVAPNTPKGKGADKFKELAEKYTNGKVKVEVYPNSTLYKDKENSRRCSSAPCRCSPRRIPSSAQWKSRTSRCSTCRSCCRTSLRYARSPKARSARMLKFLEPKGMIGLAYWDNGFKQMSANKPLHMPEDYKDRNSGSNHRRC